MQHQWSRLPCGIDGTEQNLSQQLCGKVPTAHSLFAMQTEETAAAMARAWLALPEQIKEKGWPEFVEATRRVAFFGR